MKVNEVAVIGAGLFGSVIAAKLRKEGKRVTVFDDQREFSSSKPSACLMKPSWYSGLGKEVHVPALEVLEELYGVQTVECKAGPAKVSVHWVNPSSILTSPDCEVKVKSVERVKGHPQAVRVSWEKGGGEEEADVFDAAVVATGCWAPELLPQLKGKVKGISGAAYVWSGHHLPEPFIKPWAPYKQVVAFNRNDGVWCGDGSAIKPENWSKERAEKSLNRCADAVWLPAAEARVMYGIRPAYTDGRVLLDKVDGNIWVATGGAKNGTILSGWCAHQLAKEFA